MLDLTFKTWIMWPSLLISVLVCSFLLLRSYRDHYNNGYITYGKSVGAGVVINVYAAIITALYIYVLYAFIDPGLVDQQMAMAEEKMIARGVPESAIDAGLAVQAKLMKPWTHITHVCNIWRLLRPHYVTPCFIVHCKKREPPA
ncbi:MAG: DUF4199 domain-containing protein [Marinilabiliales bacterium]|nr:DUF4199 domain-containing protein [Marinilabiliales bacterium]